MQSSFFDFEICFDVCLSVSNENVHLYDVSLDGQAGLFYAFVDFVMERWLAFCKISLSLEDVNIAFVLFKHFS